MLNKYYKIISQFNCRSINNNLVKMNQVVRMYYDKQFKKNLLSIMYLTVHQVIHKNMDCSLLHYHPNFHSQDGQQLLRTVF